MSDESQRLKQVKALSISDKDLPKWTDCEFAVDEKRATALEHFIYDYEPGDAGQWRRQLAAVIQEAKRD